MEKTFREHQQEAARARWAKITPEAKAEQLRKMQEGRKPRKSQTNSGPGAIIPGDFSTLET